MPEIFSIGVKVISPNPSLVSQASNNQSLAWDYFDYSAPTNLEDVNMEDIGLGGLDSPLGHTIRITDTSESSLSVSSFTRNMSVFANQNLDHMDAVTRGLIQEEMKQKSNDIALLLEDFNDMLDDFTPDDVNRGNTQFVNEKLKDISGARSNLRKSIREYQSLYGSLGDQKNELGNIITDVNQRLRNHANKIWGGLSNFNWHSQAKLSLSLETE